MRNASGPEITSIELQGVGRVYEGKNRNTIALDSIDLSLKRGEMIGVSGPSGSGKTTLLLVTAGLLATTQGHVFWGRRDVGGMSDGEISALRADGVGVALQTADLVETLTALENAALPGLLTRTTDAWERARSALESLEISHLADAFPDELSGGERRRVATARALCAGTAFVLIDEATADLDPVSAAVVAQALRSAADRGVGVLVTSHDAGLISHASRSYEMVSGKLEECNEL